MTSRAIQILRDTLKEDGYANSHKPACVYETLFVGSGTFRRR